MLWQPLGTKYAVKELELLEGESSPENNAFKAKPTSS